MSHELVEQLQAAQTIDPHNREDADYIAGNPREFSREVVEQAHATLDRIHN